MARDSATSERPSTLSPQLNRGGRRLRAGLRRHGVTPSPAALRDLLEASDARFTHGNRVELYRDGAAGLEAMFGAIQGARQRIHFETYIFRGDETGRRFLAALCERARAGVAVRLLYDGVGSRGLDESLLDELRRAGGDAVRFNPLGRLYPHWAPRRRDHRKILVVDGQLAFTGGLNVGDEYLHGTRQSGGPRAPWIDAYVRVQGPAACTLDAVFLESWFRADGPECPWAEIGSAAGSDAGDAIAVLPDGPSYHRRRMRELLVAALARTSHRACVATPYFLPGPRLRWALTAAAARGVRVEVLIAGYSDHPVLRWAAHHLASRLLSRGVRVFEYERAMMHAKAAVFDGSWAVVGTSNLDRQSLEHSYEVNLIADGGRLPAALSEMLDELLARARPLTAEGLRRRSWWVRLRDRIAGLIFLRL